MPPDARRAIDQRNGPNARLLNDTSPPNSRLPELVEIGHRAIPSVRHSVRGRAPMGQPIKITRTELWALRAVAGKKG